MLLQEASRGQSHFGCTGENGVWLQAPTTFVGLSIEGGRFRALGKIQQGGQRVLT